MKTKPKAPRKISGQFYKGENFLYSYAEYRRSGSEKTPLFLSKLPEVKEVTAIYRGTRHEERVASAFKWAARKTKDYGTLKTVAETLRFYHGTQEAQKVAEVIIRAAAYFPEITKTAAGVLAHRADLLKLETDTFLTFCSIYENMRDAELRDILPLGHIHDLVRCYGIILQRYSAASGELKDKLRKTFFDIMNKKTVLGKNLEEKLDIVSHWSNNVSNTLKQFM